MSENVAIVVNLIGLTVFALTGAGVSLLLSEWYYRHTGCGPYDVPIWLDLAPVIGFIIIWAALFVTLTHTVWEIHYPAVYTISISW